MRACLFNWSQHSTWSFPFIRNSSDKHLLRQVQKCLIHPRRLSGGTGDLFSTFPTCISISLYGVKISCCARIFYNQSLTVPLSLHWQYRGLRRKHLHHIHLYLIWQIPPIWFKYKAHLVQFLVSNICSFDSATGYLLLTSKAERPPKLLQCIWCLL